MDSYSRSSSSETCDCDLGIVSYNAEVRIVHERGEEMIGKHSGAPHLHTKVQKTVLDKWRTFGCIHGVRGIKGES